jgi:hypothetical protein
MASDAADSLLNLKEYIIRILISIRIIHLYVLLYYIIIVV